MSSSTAWSKSYGRIIQKLRRLAGKSGLKTAFAEHGCDYVSSRGILKSTSFHSRSPVSSTKECADYARANHDQPMSIYVCGSALGHFIDALLPRIDEPFVLVTGDCDETMPQQAIVAGRFNELMDDPRLLHWYCQNWAGDHAKVTCLPIGLDYHTMALRDYEWGPQSTPAEQEGVLRRIRDSAPARRKRKVACYANFHFTMNTQYAHDRLEAIQQISPELVHYEPAKVARAQSWRTQSEFAFVISPHGNGMDCHRTWEALCLDCIPIVKRSPISPLFHDLPVLIVDRWSDVTMQRLRGTLAEFEAKTFRGELLTLGYWVAKIHSHRPSECRQSN